VLAYDVTQDDNVHFRETHMPCVSENT